MCGRKNFVLAGVYLTFNIKVIKKGLELQISIFLIITQI